MKLPSRIKLLVISVLAAGALVALWFPFRAYILAPYQARRTMSALPVLPAGITASDAGIPSSGTFHCENLPTSLSIEELNEKVRSLGLAVEQTPSDLCSGNQFREAVRYLGLRNGHFATRVSSLPPELEAIAKDPNSVSAEHANDSKVPPDDLQPAKLFWHISRQAGGNTAEIQLQLGLSYVDLMIRQGGRENKARLSSRAIEALSSALQRQPYLIAALYARGLNYLYWPVIAGKLPLAIQDFKTCVALSNQPSLREHPPLVIAEAYRALGDSYVKLADSSPTEGQKMELLAAGRQWWQEGKNRFPEFHGFDERLKTPAEDLPARVDSIRGLETYINTNLDLLWKK